MTSDRIVGPHEGETPPLFTQHELPVGQSISPSEFVVCHSSGGEVACSTYSLHFKGSTIESKYTAIIKKSVKLRKYKGTRRKRQKKGNNIMILSYKTPRRLIATDDNHALSETHYSILSETKSNIERFLITAYNDQDEKYRRPASDIDESLNSSMSDFVPRKIIGFRSASDNVGRAELLFTKDASGRSHVNCMHDQPVFKSVDLTERMKPPTREELLRFGHKIAKIEPPK